MVLDLITIEELRRKCVNETNFKWIFNSKNKNIIPVLELYNKEGVYRTIESIEFTEPFQKIFEKIQKLYDFVNNTHDSELREEFVGYLMEEETDCSECEIKEMCPFGMDKDEQN